MNTDAIDLLIRRELPAAAGGDRDAYGRIIQASQNTVTAVALAITRDVPTSEDIAQEAFLSPGSTSGGCRIRPASCPGCGRSPATWRTTTCERAAIVRSTAKRRTSPSPAPPIRPARRCSG